jgi:hypothetical protein
MNVDFLLLVYVVRKTREILFNVKFASKIFNAELTGTSCLKPAVSPFMKV